MATAVMVMGVEKFIDLVNRLQNVECFFVVQKAGEKLMVYQATGLKVEN